MYTSQYPWRTRIGWECRGHMYFVDVCEAECLDVARGLWLTGAEYLTLFLRGDDVKAAWKYQACTYRGSQTGGYSSKE